jgi:D-alanyl-D-alanine carboxypeptidase/D-alanyl-D-alanine-endopeptidase (penicillin-binding protein 4)
MLKYGGVRLCLSTACTLIVLCSLTGDVGGSDWRLARNLDRILSEPALEGAFVGVFVLDLETGRVLYQKNPDLLFIPASCQKLLTTAASLYWLGPDYRFRTSFGTPDSVGSDSVLYGDLLVRAGGDPSFSESFGIDPDSLFLTWADSLRAEGIGRIKGSLKVDESAFDRARLGYGWDWHYLSRSYAPEVSAFSYNDNSVLLRVSPGARAGIPAVVGIHPEASFIALENDAVTSDTGGETALSVERKALSNEICVSGSLAVGRAGESRRVSVHDPALLFAERLELALEQKSMAVEGGALVCGQPSGAGQEIFSYYSPALESIVCVTNRMSMNLSAEMLFKTIGGVAFEEGTFENGARAVGVYMSRIGVDSSAFVCVDGSGLSRRNLVSPRALVWVLRAEWSENGGGPFVRSLPVSGSPGTLEGRMKSPSISGRIRAKTGTLDQTSALSGYVSSISGRHIAFAMLSNHFASDLNAVRAVEEELGETLVRYRPSHLGPWEKARWGKVR